MRLSLLYATPLLAISVAATASDEQQPPAPAVQQVEVKGPDSGQLRREDSVGRIVVGREELQRYGDTTIADALKRQPGIAVVGGEIRMRGLGSGYTQILVDGQPVSANFDIAALPPELIDKVEIQRSAQADASMQAVAGSLNFILRKASGASGTPGGSARLGAEQQAGATSPTATAQWTARSGTVGYGLTTTVSDIRRRDDAVTDTYATAPLPASLGTVAGNRSAGSEGAIAIGSGRAEGASAFGFAGVDGAAAIGSGHAEGNSAMGAGGINGTDAMGSGGVSGASAMGAGAVSQRRLHDRQATRSRRLSAAPRIDVKQDGGDSLTWQGLVDAARQDASGAQSETTLAGAPTASPENDWRSRFDSWLLKSDLASVQHFGAGKLTLKAGIEASHRGGDYRFRGIDAAGMPSLDRAVASTADERRASTSGKYLAPLWAGHGIALGWDAAGVRRSESRHQRDTGAAGPASAPLYVLDQDYQASVRQLALYAQDEWTVTARLQAYVGLRWEGLTTRTRGPGTAATATRAWSPVAQLVWKLPDSARNQMRLALARTYKAPQPRDLVPRRYTINNDNGPTQPDYQGNPLLRPELAWGLDAALESYLARDAMVSVSAYARRIRDVVQLRLWQENGVWVSSPVNHGTATVHGLELDARLPLHKATASSTGIDVRANLGRNWSRVAAAAGPDNRLGNQAPLTANLGLDVKTPGGISAGANLRVVGGWRASTAPGLTDTTGVVRELEAYAAWPAAGARWRLTVANLLRPDRRSGLRYDDGSETSSRHTARAQHPLVRLQVEVQR